MINLRSKGGLIFLPSIHQCSVLRVFKVVKPTQKKRSGNKDVMSQGIELGTSRNEDRAPTTCATLAPNKINLSRQTTLG